jgi:aminoglycoside phosphotransferase (APT) family kinase protein
VQELLGGRDDGWRLVEEEQLKRHVHRLRFRAGGDERSFVVKRSTPEVARRNRLVATRWLPAIGLDAHGPALLALAPDPATGRVWHVYEDLGRQVLEAENPVRDHVEATVAVLARLHAGFIEHPLLPECRRTGGELGMRFYSSNVRGGIAALRALRHDDDAGERVLAIAERLLDRLCSLQRQERERAQALSGLGVPETLLHGDLWTVNVMLVPTAAGLRARLIDWDHAGVGPISYDLSTFLLRFAPEHRRWILEAYRREAERVAGWQLPPDAELDLLFETAEYARFSSVARGRAQAVRSPHAGWAVEGLEWVDGWFEAYEPVLCP